MRKYLPYIAGIGGIVAVIAAGPMMIKDNPTIEGGMTSPRHKTTSDKGIYITASVAQTKSFFERLKKLCKDRGLNTMVIDAKYQIEGQLLPIVKEKKLDRNTQVVPSPWLEKLITELHDEGFIVSVRLVTFKDDHLILARPDLSIILKNGKPYRDHKGGRWADPYSPEVRLYNELLAEIAAISGADEVQFDYIRFPAEGEAGNIALPYYDGRSRVDVITGFLRDTRNRLAKYNVSMAVDIFGITAWENSRKDVLTLGQSLEAMAEYLDVLSPMFYPSHFHRGFDNHARPGDEPYFFVSQGIAKTKKLLEGKSTKIVPWIQGFAMETSWFGPKYIEAQIQACRDQGVDSFLIWNARNVYDAAPAIKTP